MTARLWPTVETVGECDAVHPVLLSVTCHLRGPHKEHSGFLLLDERGHVTLCPTAGGREWPVNWTPTALADYPQYAARASDPQSSHEFADRDFGATGLAADVLAAVDLKWRNCRQLATGIFGPGPYTYDEAVRLNKVQTVALKLWRQGLLDRREHGTLQYRKKGHHGDN